MAEISEIGGNPIRDTTAYHKPSTGIPKSDLADAVKTSLGKADTALQSFTETDPTVPSWAKQPSKPSYNFSEINSRGEAWLEWGGRSLSGNVTPIGMSLSQEHSANRMAFINPDAIGIEYSSDNGTTWSDYNLNAAGKKQLFTTAQEVSIGPPSTEARTLSMMTRVTITAQNGTTEYLYISPKKMLIQMATACGAKVIVEYRSGNRYKTGGDWDRFGEYAVGGWTGWNDIPLKLSTLGGSSGQTDNNWQLRLTFVITSTRTDTYSHYAKFCGIRIYSDNAWYVVGSMGKNGHLYSYDINRNATFPARVNAESFARVNGTSAQFLKADGSIDSNTYLTSHQDISGKVDKVTEANKVYATGGNGEPYNLSWSTAANAYSFAVRDAGGVLNVGTPTANNHATTKKYVDDGLSGKQDTLTAGNGLSKSGNTISVDPSKIPVISRDSWYGGLVPYCTGVTNSIPSWDAAFVSNDAVPYAIAQRNNKGTITGCQDQLYVHEGTVTIDGIYMRYKVLSKKSTAFTNPQTDFPEKGNLFTLRTGPNILYNLWYDDSDGTYYYTDNVHSGTSYEYSSYTVIINTDIVYAL